MTSPADVVDSLSRLPATPCTSFRGCPDGATFLRPAQVTVATGLVATSRNLDTATDGGRTSSLYAIIGRTGRYVAPFSAHQEQREVVYLPGTAFAIARSMTTGPWTVHLVFEIEIPVRHQIEEQTIAAAEHELDQLLSTYTASAGAEGPPGKFVGDIV